MRSLRGCTYRKLASRPVVAGEWSNCRPWRDMAGKLVAFRRVGKRLVHERDSDVVSVEEWDRRLCAMPR